MKKNKVIEECGYMLTEETLQDKRLNPIDLNTLAVLQFIEDGKGANSDGFFNIILKDGEKIRTSLQGFMSDFGVKCDYTTISRSINKLQRIGYIDYLRGSYNNKTKVGYWPKVQILKGTVKINRCNTDNCGIIAIAQEMSNCNNPANNCDTDKYGIIAIAQEDENDPFEIEKCEKLNACETTSCGVIAIAQEKEKEKENKKEYILKGDNTMKNNRLENCVSDTSEGDGFNMDNYNTFSNWKDRIEYCVSVPVLVPHQDRKEARSWVFRKWQSYLQAITAGDLSWGVTFQYLQSFLNWLKVTSNDLEWYRGKRGELRSQFRHAALKRFFNEYGEMIEGAKTEYIHRPADYSSAYNANIDNLKHIYSLGGETREGEREDALTKARVMWEQVTVPQLEKVTVADPDEENRSNGGGLLILSTITGRPAPATPKPSMVRSDYGDLPFSD